MVDFVTKSLMCQKVKAKHQRGSNLLYLLSIHEWKWEHDSIDFIVRLLEVRSGYNALWVIVNHLTKSTHF